MLQRGSDAASSLTVRSKPRGPSSYHIIPPKKVSLCLETYSSPARGPTKFCNGNYPGHTVEIRWETRRRWQIVASIHSFALLRIIHFLLLLGILSYLNPYPPPPLLSFLFPSTTSSISKTLKCTATFLHDSKHSSVSFHSHSACAWHWCRHKFIQLTLLTTVHLHCSLLFNQPPRLYLSCFTYLLQFCYQL